MRRRRGSCRRLAAAESSEKKEREIERSVRGDDLAGLLRCGELLKTKSATGGLPQMRFTAGRGP